jgi:hypothetical protein
MFICDVLLNKMDEGGGLAGRRQRGHYVKGTSWRRDLRVAQMVARVAERGFPPTRNAASRTESACSIVSTALQRCGVHMSERRVEGIWNNVRIKFALSGRMTNAQLATVATRGDRLEDIISEYLQELQRGRRRSPHDPIIDGQGDLHAAREKELQRGRRRSPR